MWGAAGRGDTGGMYSSIIGKVQKAHQYAQERDRVCVQQIAVTIHGDNDDHEVSYRGGVWSCTCHFFAGYGICSHTMALERILGVMVPVKQHYPEPLHAPEVLAATGA